MIAAAAAVLAASGLLHATVGPAVAAKDGQVRIEVSGLNAPRASVHLAGGLASGGRWFGWVALRPRGPGSWWTVLRAPGYLGAYPVDVRAGGSVRRADAVVLVLPRGFFARPTFDRPEQVAEWWARTAPPGATLRSVSTWRRGFFTARDPALNRLLRVRFTLLGSWPALRLRRGPGEIYLSVTRVRTDGGWRLVETVAPP